MGRFEWRLPDPDPNPDQDHGRAELQSPDTDWSHFDDDDGLEYSHLVCTPRAFPELHADLDLALLGAADEFQRWEVLIAGTREALERLASVAARFNNTGTIRPQFVLGDLRTAVSEFTKAGAPSIAEWLEGFVGIASAHDELHRHWAERITAAIDHGHDHAVTTINEAAASVRAAAEAVAVVPIPEPPHYRSTDPWPVRVATLYALSAELKREPLSVDVAGAGGLAATAEFNPYFAALEELELATHRRFYRLFFRLAQAVGIDTTDANFRDPDLVDRQQLAPGFCG